jgi:hypothetical protein
MEFGEFASFYSWLPMVLTPHEINVQVMSFLDSLLFLKENYFEFDLDSQMFK